MREASDTESESTDEDTASPESASPEWTEFVRRVSDTLKSVGTVFRVGFLHAAAVRAEATQEKNVTRFQRALMSSLERLYPGLFHQSSRVGQPTYVFTTDTETRGVEEGFRLWVVDNAASRWDVMDVLQVPQAAESDRVDESSEKGSVTCQLLALIDAPKDPPPNSVLLEAAFILSQAMDQATGCNGVLMPADFSYEKCVDSAGEVLVGFLHVLLTRRARREDCLSDHWRLQAVALAQIIQACRAGGKQTPLHLALALAGRHEASPGFVETLHSFGLVAANRVARHVENYYASLGLRDGLMELRDIVTICREEGIAVHASAVYDNLNFRTKGKVVGVGGADIGSLALILTFPDGGIEELESRGILNRAAPHDVKPPTAAPMQENTEGVHVYHKKRANPPYSKDNLSPVSTSALSAYKKEVQTWAVIRATRPDVEIGFVEFARAGRAHTEQTQQRDRQLMLTLVPICETPESDEAIAQLLAQLQEVMQLCGQEEIVVTVDAGMFYRVAQIVWGHRGLKERIVVLPGGWHAAWTALKAMGSWFKGTFLMQWLLESGLFATRTALIQAIVHPVHFHRAMHAHDAMFEVLLTELWKEFFSSHATGSTLKDSLGLYLDQAIQALNDGKLLVPHTLRFRKDCRGLVSFLGGLCNASREHPPCSVRS